MGALLPKPKNEYFQAKGYGYYWNKPLHSMKFYGCVGKFSTKLAHIKRFSNIHISLSISKPYNIHAMKPKILILGGGSGGLVSANKLAKILKDQAEITLIIYAQLPLGGYGL